MVNIRRDTCTEFEGDGEGITYSKLKMSSVSQYTGLLLVVIFVAVFAVLAVSTMAIYFFCKCKKKKKKVRQIRPTVKREEEEEDEEQGIFFQRGPRGRGLHWVTCTEIESPRIPGVSGNYVVPHRIPSNEREYHRITQRVSVDNDGNYNSRNYTKRNTFVSANATDQKKPKVQLIDGGGNSRIDEEESEEFKEIQRVRYFNDAYYENVSRTKASGMNSQVAENTKPTKAIEDGDMQRNERNNRESSNPLNWKNIDDGDSGENKLQAKIINVDSAENYNVCKWGSIDKAENQNKTKRINVDNKNNKPGKILPHLDRDREKDVTGPIQIPGDGDRHFKLSERVKGDLNRIMSVLGENNSSSQEYTSDDSQANVNTSGGIFTKPQRIKVRESMSRERNRDSISRERNSDGVSYEKVRNSMSRERNTDNILRENVRDSMSRERNSDNILRENVRDSMSRERDRIRDSMSRESGITRPSILGKRQRTTKYDNDKPREARTMTTTLGSDPSSYMFTASSKTAWMLDS